MITVECRVDKYEDLARSGDELIVRSHQRDDEWVILCLGKDGRNITVKAKDLLTAIQNVTNTNRDSWQLSIK